MNTNLSLKYFLLFINKYKWWVISIPIICTIITYFFVRNLPKTYVSEALISTGITSQAQKATALGDGQNMDYMKLSQQFDNLLEMMKSKRMLSTLSYKLFLHDLKDPKNAFKSDNEFIKSLPDIEKQKLIKESEVKYLNNELIVDRTGNKLYDAIRSMGYDEGSLLGSLDIKRNGESDFIKVTYTSNNPQLSAYVVNNLSADFIQYYTNLAISSQKQSLAVLDTLLKQRQTEMQRKTSELASSSAAASSNSASAANSQRRADIVNSQISEAQSQRSQIIRTINSIEASIKEIDVKLAGGGGYINNTTSQANSQITNIDNQLAIANQRYVNNGMKSNDKATIDSLNNIKTRLIAQLGNNGNLDPTSLKQNLLNQKIQFENQLASAKSTLVTIDDQIRTLGPSQGLVANSPGVDGSQQILLQDAQSSVQNLAQSQAQYDQILLSAKTGSKLGLAEPGIPGPPEKSKNLFYLGFSGISSLMICLLALFIVFMFNKKLDNAEQLTNATKQKVIGSINNISYNDKDLREIWRSDGSINEYRQYKDHLRSLRFELLEHLNNENNVLGITSLRDGVGKSFVAGGLSYAFATMGKNVLLICDSNSSLMDIVTNKKGKEDLSINFESFIVKKEILIEDRITILNRNPNNNSILELRNGNSLASAFKVLKETFDIIIIDIDSAQDIHKVKEWLMYSDYSIGVFKAGDEFTSSDLTFSQYLGNHKGFLGWVLNKLELN